MEDKYRGWLVLFALFVTVFVNYGSANACLSIFMTPMMRTYGWDHARVSAIATGAIATPGLIAPAVGWLLDRVNARSVIASGALLVALGLMGASRADSFWLIFGAFTIVGIGVGATAVVPAAVVAANWFSHARGFAIAIGMSGGAVGGMVMPLLTSWWIERFGMKETFVILAVPEIVLVVPLALLVIRTRPASLVRRTVAEEIKDLPGLELGEALRTRSFWILAFVQLVVSASITGTFYHLVSFLIHVGYTPQHAALAQSCLAAAAIPGGIVMGMLADRISGRRVFAVAAIVMAIGCFIILGARGGSGWLVAIVAFDLAFGASCTSTTFLTPVVLVETLGIKRFGSINGFLNPATALGMTVGALAVGSLVDRTGSYAQGFELCGVLSLIGGFAILLVHPAEKTQAIPASAMQAIRGH